MTVYPRYTRTCSNSFKCTCICLLYSITNAQCFSASSDHDEKYLVSMECFSIRRGLLLKPSFSNAHVDFCARHPRSMFLMALHEQPMTSRLLINGIKITFSHRKKVGMQEKRINQGSEWEEFEAVIVRVGRLFHALEFNCTNVANGPSGWKLPKFNQRIKALKKLVSFLRLSTEN